MTVALVCGLSLTSCKDEESSVANAVIVSTRAIEFPNANAVPVTVNVTSDGDWHVDAPEWLIVSPSTGVAGRTEVTIEAVDNIKTGAPDRPRKYALKFMGEKSLSAFQVTVQQAGDKYRDLEPITIDELAALEDDEAAMLGGVTVYANTESGIVVTDGTQLAYVTKSEVENGKKVDVVGSKFEADGFAYLVGESVKEQGAGTMPTFTAEDITGKLDKYKSAKQVIVKATGAFDGAIVNVEGQTNNVQVIDADKALNIAQYKGHQIEVTGVYSGTAAPVVKVIATAVKDLGLNETILFQDDFDWLSAETNIDTYESGGKPVSDNVGDKMLKGAYNPQSTTLKNPDGESVWDLLIKRGYNMYSTTESQAKKSIGCAKYYIKMAVTTYTAKLELPKMPEAGDGMEGVRLSFDWTPMTDGGNAIWDQTEIAVEVTTNGKTTYIPIDGVAKQDGFVEGSTSQPKTPYEWVRVDILLDGLTINKDTRIALRNADPDYPQTAVTGQKKRWFVDNIKVYKPKQ